MSPGRLLMFQTDGSVWLIRWQLVRHLDKQGLYISELESVSVIIVILVSVSRECNRMSTETEGDMVAGHSCGTGLAFKRPRKCVRE